LEIVQTVLLLFLIACAVAVSLTRKLWQAIIIFLSYSLVMAIVWAFMQAPDLAITEAAVGAGITSFLFFVTLKRINALKKTRKEGEQEDWDDNEE